MDYSAVVRVEVVVFRRRRQQHVASSTFRALRNESGKRRGLKGGRGERGLVNAQGAEHENCGRRECNIRQSDIQTSLFCSRTAISAKYASILAIKTGKTATLKQLL